MSKLLLAELHRCIKSKLFWINMLAALGIGIYSGKETVVRFDSYFVLITLILNAAFFTLHIGTEFSSGGIRSKLTTGASRAELFFSKLIVTSSVGLFCGALFIMGFLVYQYSTFRDFFYGQPLYEPVMLLLAILLIYTANAVICCTVSFLVPYRTAVSVIIACLFIMGSEYACHELNFILDMPENVNIWITHDKYGDSMGVDSLFIDPDSVGKFDLSKYPHHTQDEPDGSITDVYDIPNERYISHDDIRYKALTALYYIQPIGQLTELEDISIMFWSPCFNNYTENYDIIYYFPLYSLAMICISAAVGYLSFYKRDLR